MHYALKQRELRGLFGLFFFFVNVKVNVNVNVSVKVHPLNEALPPHNKSETSCIRESAIRVQKK